MGSRRQSRILAVQALYQLDLNPGDLEKSLQDFRDNFPAPEESVPFFRRLVEGVWERKEELDLLLKRHSENWRLDRMSPVDRNILRLAAFEMQYCADVPPKAALNEAIDLGKRFGSEESGAFINGILDSLFIEIQSGSEREKPGPDNGKPRSRPAPSRRRVEKKNPTDRLSTDGEPR
ncbi:MAG: transcription antitermination factor NusB, partial [Deltaproteobacteria bacterium]|nr:transcription antitermination factor NusB [Deltaproteobacteria bacterium]